MKNGQISLVSCPASETRYPAILHTQNRVLLSVGFGRQKALWVLGSLRRIRSHPESQANVDAPVSQIELVALAWSLLALARQATAVQAKAYLHTQARRISISIRPAWRSPKR
jgi:hypothetical protein